jgi:hypothetical protein
MGAGGRRAATLRRMRAFQLLTTLLLAGCAGAAVVTETSGDPLSPDLFPFDAPPAPFADGKDPAPRTLRVERGSDASTSRLVFEAPGGPPRELRVVRRGDSLFFSNDLEMGTELLRGGALPGDAWESDGRRIRFDGWDRVTSPARTYDAAKITARRGPAGLEEVETWWFAKGVGLVRLRSDHGAMFVDEMVRSSP